MKLVLVIIAGLVFMGGCDPAIARAPTAPTEPVAAPRGTTPTKTADEWRAQKQQLLDQIDANLKANASLAQQIEATDRRAALAEQEAQRATARTQAAWGRRIAFLCFAASVIITILSFTPWGSIIPRWAGPAGMAAGVAILVAAHYWVWASDHVMLLALIIAGLGGVVVLFAIGRGTLLLRIRQRFSHAMETATSEADELNAKAKSLAAELDAGVHRLGQRLRGKPVKTWADVAQLEEAAQDKTRIRTHPQPATP